MKSHLPILAACLFALATSAASAQSVVIQPEQETVIREYVVQQNVEPIEVPADVTIEVGATFPETVELHMIEAPDVEVEYRYVVVDGRTVLVEPETREIVHIIE
jgi:hypothetical protein